MRIAVVTNAAWNLVNFRLGLMRHLQAAGHEVVAIAPEDKHARIVEASGIEFMHVPIAGQGVNPVSELRTVMKLRAALRESSVDAVFSYTPKGNLYTALACMGAGPKFVPTVSGLGRAFIRKSLLTLIVKTLYRLTFRRAAYVLFQNFEDLELFIAKKFVRREKAFRVAGSGIDLVKFSPQPLVARNPESPVFLLIGRMLWDKGVGEFVDAARMVLTRFPNARFQLLGFLDVANPSAISSDQVKAWVQEGVVEYLGSSDDVRNAMAGADCIVLPSYREGIPRTLLEAAALSRPVITTNVPGCRDAIIAGETGLLCKAASASDLAEKMLDFIAMDHTERKKMGAAGRRLMERSFDEKLVYALYAGLATELAGSLAAAGKSGLQATPAAMRTVMNTPSPKDDAALNVQRIRESSAVSSQYSAPLSQKYKSTEVE